MITIKPADEATRQQLNAPPGTEALVLRESDGRISGHALFCVTGDTVEIIEVAAEEPLMTDGLVRSVLNAGDFRGAQFGFCRDRSLKSVLERLEFRQRDDGYHIVIDDFFHAPCPGEEENT